MATRTKKMSITIPKNQYPILEFLAKASNVHGSCAAEAAAALIAQGIDREQREGYLARRFDKQMALEIEKEFPPTTG